MDDQQLRIKMQYIAFNQSMLSQRFGLDGSEGLLMDGNRDIYEAAGYPKYLDFKRHYKPMYERGGIAARIVNAPADESWRKLPQIYEGDSPDTGDTETAFCKAWNEFAKNFGKRGLYHYLHRLDRVSGIGRFGVLFFGLAGDDDLTQPVTGQADLRYVTVLEEGSVSFGVIDSDVQSPRFGMPETYHVTVEHSFGMVRDGSGNSNDSKATSQTMEVHHSRILHVAEDATTNDLFGTPRLKAGYNYLLNIMKILAGAGEAAWKLMDSGNLFTTADGYELPRQGSAERKALEEQVENHWNGLTRGLLAEGLAPMPIGGSVTDPSGLVNIFVSMLSATIDMPQRILMGSERGELASSQDSIDWLESIEERRQNHVEPMILRPIIEMLAEWGVLPNKPKSYGFKWARLVKDDRVGGANVASSMANALNAMGIEVEPEEFVKVYAPDLDASKVQKKEVPQPLAGPMTATDRQRGAAKEMAANIAHELWGDY